MYTCNSFMSINASVHAQSRSILNSEVLSRSCDLVFIKLSPQSSSAFPLVRRIVQAESQEHGILYFHSSASVSLFTHYSGGEFKRHIKPLVSDVSK